jgi:hypothetical protein
MQDMEFHHRSSNGLLQPVGTHRISIPTTDYQFSKLKYNHNRDYNYQPNCHLNLVMGWTTPKFKPSE